MVTTKDDYNNLSPFTGSVTLSTSGGTGVLGTLGSPAPTADFAGSSSVTLTGVRYSGYANGVSLTATTSTGLSDSETVNVYAFVTVADATVGTALSLQNTGCTDATPGVPVCSSLILPKGANGRVTLGQQICNPFTPCLNSSEDQANLVEALANLKNAAGKAIYTRTAPAVLEFRCDKTLCGGTGVNNFPILFQVTGQTAFTTAPECTTKGRIGANQDFCADVKANKRDNAGDLVATVLFLDDLRSTIKP